MMLRGTTVWLAIIFALLPVVFLPAQNYPLKLTDDTGVAVVITKAPQRIVSLALYADEMLKDLVDVRRMAAVSDFAVDPGISNVAAWAAQVKVHLPLAVEAVLALKPDLVLVSQWSDDAKVRQLRQSGVAVFGLRSPRSFADSKAVIKTLGRLCGVTDKAEAVVAGIDKRLRTIDARVAAIPPNRRPSLLEFNTWGSGSGTSTSWNSVLLQGGFRNPLSTFKQDEWGQVPVTKELLLTMNPDYLLVADWVYGDASGAEKLLKSLRSDPVLAALTAVRSNRILLVPGRFKEVASQYMVDAAEYLLAEAERFAFHK